MKPLFKKEFKTNPSNCSRISLLPLISKIIEELIHEQKLVLHLTMKFHTTTNHDFGKTTRQTHASRFCMIKFWRLLIRVWWLTWYWFTSRSYLIRLTMTYYWKKLSDISFSNHTIGWFKSSFSNWLFRVNLENCYSDSFNITCRVSQGSILGPLLFLICMNDMVQAVKSNLFLYADDSFLFFRESML